MSFSRRAVSARSVVARPARSPYLGRVYTTCLRCSRSLGANTEIPHLQVGRKVAFDTHRGRVWVICPKCGQWNLTPLEERWEALEECERLAAKAEAHTEGTKAALAQTASGLELLRVGGMSDADIANWRYGRRMSDRTRRRLWMLMPLQGIAVSTGILMWRDSHHAGVSLFTTALVGVFLYKLWRKPPRLWTRFDDGKGRTRLLWVWQRQRVRIESRPGERAVLVLPRIGGDLRLTGQRAAIALASLLPRINGADCSGAHLPQVVSAVSSAERYSREAPAPARRRRRKRQRSDDVSPTPPPPTLRPWEVVAHRLSAVWLTSALPEDRLALEMAVTEEVEQQELSTRAEGLVEQWHEEEEIGAISDDLLLPDSVRERLDQLRRK